MRTHIIATGGTGQHGVLAYLRLCVICQGLFDLKEPEEHFLPRIYIFDKDKGGKSLPDIKTAAELVSESAAYLGYSPIFIDPTPSLKIEDKSINTLKDLFQESDLIKLLFNKDQRDVEFRKGNFGHPAVGSTVYLAKLQDIHTQDGVTVNKDTKYSDMESAVKNAVEQRFVHIGSTIGGTGSGVMPALLSRICSLKEGNFHLAIPYLEWFNLKGNDEKTIAFAEKRNKMMRQNRSSGLSFYLNVLKKNAAVVPIGYSNANMNKYTRQWDNDYNQAVKETALHLAAALVTWDFYHQSTPYTFGMYSFVPNDKYEIPSVSKIGEYTLYSIVKANLELIKEIKWICNYLRNDWNNVLKHVLLKSFRDQFLFPLIRKFSKEDWRIAADKLEGVANRKRTCCEWLCGLDDIDPIFKKIKGLSDGELVNFFDLQELIPRDSTNKEDDLSKSILTHLYARARFQLEKLSPNHPTSANRLLPDYAISGTTPPPSPQGQAVRIEDTQHITQLYTSSDIHPRSIPSPLGITYYMNSVCFDVKNDPDTIREDWLRKFCLLLKGLAANIFLIEKYSLEQETTFSYNIELLIRNLPQNDDNSWKDITYYYQFKTKIKGEEIIFGATSPSTFVFPSMSVADEKWDQLEGMLKGSKEIEAMKLITAWRKEIEQWDDTPKNYRPFWFRSIQSIFNEQYAFERTFIWLEDEFQVMWNDKVRHLPFPVIDNTRLSGASWDRLRNLLGAKNLYFNGENLYDDPEYKEDKLIPTDNDKTMESLLNVCKDVISGEGVVPSYLLSLTKEGLKQEERIFIWLDLKMREISGIILSSDEEGTISLIRDRSRVLFDSTKFHGILPQTVCLDKVITFEEKPGIRRYPDSPVMLKYLCLISENGHIKSPSYKGDLLEYTINMQGRVNPFTVSVIPDKRRLEISERGTVLLWPDFECPGWKSYYIYRDGDESFRELSLRVLMSDRERKNSTWSITQNIIPGQPSAITLDRLNFEESPGSRLLKYSNWLDTIPRYILIQKRGKEVGLLKLSLTNCTAPRKGSESWGIDFGTSGSIIAFQDQRESRCLDIREDCTSTILSFSSDEKDEPLYSKKKIGESGRWFLTFPVTRPDKNKFILSELTFPINLREFENNLVPGESIQLISTRIPVNSLTNNWIGGFKWQNDRESVNIEAARQGYLALYLLMAIADRIRFAKQGVFKTISPIISYPLRMGNDFIQNYKFDIKTACEWVRKGTGIDFEIDKMDFLCESIAVSYRAESAIDLIVADLGGGTLDLWMGNRSTITENSCADSIKIGGFNLLKFLATNFKTEVQRLIQSDQPNSSNDSNVELLFHRKILSGNHTDIKNMIKKSTEKFKHIIDGYFTLAVEYISRFAAGYITRKGFPANQTVEIQMAIAGNGWKLEYKADSLKDIPNFIALQVQNRIEKLLSNIDIKFTPLIVTEDGLKEDVAIGLLNAKQSHMELDSHIKTFAGLDCDSEKSFTWLTPIPFVLGGVMSNRILDFSKRPQNGVYLYHPQLPDYNIKDEVYMDFLGIMNGRHSIDQEIYTGKEKGRSLVVSPFGILLEIMTKKLDSWR